MKKILIAGGTGSFGSTIAEHFLNDKSIEEVRIFSRDELKQHEMRMKFQDDRLKFIIGDVRDFSAIFDAQIGVDSIFHAAALKQVPSCEFYPMEAVQTNIIGVENMLRAANMNGISRVVVLSTDKAVYPINAMGMSKALMEKVVVAASRRSDTNRFCLTRYGNVMASRGSVIPTFIEQAMAGAPLTVTNPSMTRFLMTLQESVDLVLFAFANARAGDVFVQKAPACTTLDLAKAIIELFGSKSEIRVIGARHGEKLHESLLSREEWSKAEELDRYYRIPSDNRNLNYEKYLEKGDLKIRDDDYNSQNTVQLNIKKIKEKLLEVDFVKRKLKG